MSDRGRSSEERACCGDVLKPDLLVRIRAVQIVVSGKEETALMVYLVTDSKDHCYVGFLRWYMVKYMKKYNGRIAQIVEIFSDKSESCIAYQKHLVVQDDNKKKSKKHRINNSKSFLIIFYFISTYLI